MLIAYLAAAAAVAVPQATPIDRGSWFKETDYPFEAMKAGIQGSVTFEVEVDANGNPTDCRVTKSSGKQMLDQATCDVARARARFKPALGSDGTPVAGRYSTQAVWRLSGPGTIYSAVILDYSADPDHPVCSVTGNVPTPPWLTCDRATKQEQLPQWIGTRYSKLVILYAMTQGEAEPFHGPPEWGDRISYFANDFYLLKGQFPPICITVATEGLAAGKDGCAGSPAPHAISEADKKAAIRSRTEISMFAISRPRARTAACKSRDSAAEARACE
jgi:TonB family protein